MNAFKFRIQRGRQLDAFMLHEAQAANADGMAIHTDGNAIADLVL